MHPNPAYRQAAESLNLDFAKARGFGILTTAGDPFPMLSHIPFLIGEAEGGPVVDMHLVRSNPMARALVSGARPAVLAVSGPHGYVSPEWYGDAQQVPTWNYVAVHLRGSLSLRPAETLRDHLAALSARFEGELPKKAWTLDKMDEDALARLERMILPARLQVAEVDGTWKLNQNKAEAMRLGAAEHIPGSLGAELSALADLMRAPPA